MNSVIEYLELLRSVVPDMNVPSAPLRKLADGTPNMTCSDDEK
jgi:hypothetical protein